MDLLLGAESEETVDDPTHYSIFDVNTVVNYDPAIVPYLDVRPPVAFERSNGAFVEVPFEHED